MLIGNKYHLVGATSMVKKLLSGNNEGIDIMKADGETALQMAIRQKNLEMIFILLQYDAGIL